MNAPIKHKQNSTGGIFYLEDEKEILTELTYTKSKHILTIDHTKTKIEREGEGLASKLVAEIVIYARDTNQKIFPLCPFAEVQFDRHPEYRDVLS